MSPSPSPADKPASSLLRIALYVVLVSFVPRTIAWLWVAVGHIAPHGDERNYWEMAQAIQRHDWSAAYGNGIWPPLMPALLAISPTLEGARLINMVFGALTVIPLFLLAQRLSGTRAGLWAASIFGLYPVFVAFSHLLWSEAIFTFLLASCSYVYVLQLERPKPEYVLTIGICLGLMGLTRSSVMLFALGFVGLLAYRGQWRSGLMALAIACVMWAPWLFALHRAEGRFVFFSTANGYNLYWGNNPYLPLVEDPVHDKLNLEHCRAYYNHLHSLTGGKTIREFDVTAGHEALAFIDANRGWFLARVPIKIGELWAHDWFVRRHFVLGIYPKLAVANEILAIDDVGHYLILALGLVGIVCLRRHRRLFVMILLAGSLLPIIGPSQTRYNLPMLMMLVVPAGIAISRLPEWFRSREPALEHA